MRRPVPLKASVCIKWSYLTGGGVNGPDVAAILILWLHWLDWAEPCAVEEGDLLSLRPKPNCRPPELAWAQNPTDYQAEVHQIFGRVLSLGSCNKNERIKNYVSFIRTENGLFVSVLSPEEETYEHYSYYYLYPLKKIKFRRWNV